ncbi:Neprilysin-2 [Trichinella murrelli]|uniref:Neprilysin-2 n=1 Tax=Trichinella murrelli TaxID=144512 RepID=A0A0V0UBP1_9BILA|nr:Neprilysin-2 [Trichinella murrelli]
MPTWTKPNLVTDAEKAGRESTVTSTPTNNSAASNGENLSEDSCVYLVDQRRRSSSASPRSTLIPFDLQPVASDSHTPASPTVTFASKANFCWSTRTKLEKCLVCTLLLMIFSIGALLLLLLTSSNARGFSYGSLNHPAAVLNDRVPICTTKGCVEAAANLLLAIDSTQDPCENFYEYACGQWNRHFSIPDDMSGYGTFALVRDRVRRQLKNLLESAQNKSSRAIQMAQMMYKSCMNTTAINALKSTNMIKVLELFGGWPILKPNWNSRSIDLTEIIGQMRGMYSLDVFFSLYVYADAKNTTRNILTIHQGSLGLGPSTREYYLNDSLYHNQMAAYQRYFTRIVQIIAADTKTQISDAQIAREIEEILKFEKTYAAITSPDDQRRNHSLLYNRWTIQQLKENVPVIKWNIFFRKFMPEKVMKAINNDTAVIVTDLNYITQINKLLTVTDKRILVNYLMWRLVKAWASMLDERYDMAFQEFVQVMVGRQSRPARWKICVPAVVGWMEMATGALYVKAHFNQKDKDEALAMIDHLRLAFTDLVEKLDWMDYQTKQIAIEKAREMINHIGYPEFINNDTVLDKYYDGVSFVWIYGKNMVFVFILLQLHLLPNDSYFEIGRKASFWLLQREMFDLLRPFDRNRFDTSPAIVNAFYSPEKNVITFPAGILQPPFFNGEYLKAINYGSIGAVIGHEITHGFDDQGSQYDKNGNLKDWWTPTAFDRFRERTTCIIEQYNNYTVPDINIKVNGRLTQGENIADNAGVKEAYMAYRKYIEDNGSEEPRLPGLVNMTNDQIFFLSYANFWCGHKKPAAALQQVLTDPHSPEMFRVIGVLSNLDEFAKTFNCKPGTKMNPLPSTRRKCSVW